VFLKHGNNALYITHLYIRIEAKNSLVRGFCPLSGSEIAIIYLESYENVKNMLARNVGVWNDT
jgi:hypothetical protein